MTCDVMFPSAAAIQAAVGITYVIGRQQKTTIINESGLYSVILQSSKPEAKRFRKWITSEVLPTIGRLVSLWAHARLIRRYNANWDRIDPGFFSVISELVIRLWSRTVRAGLCPGQLHHGHHHANVMRAKIPGSVTLQNRFSLLMRMRAKWGSLGAG